MGVVLDDTGRLKFHAIVEGEARVDISTNATDSQAGPEK